MRARSPKDEIQHIADVVSLPTPKYAVGTRIDIYRISAANRAFYWQQIVRETIRETRRVVTKLQRKGYVKSAPGKLPEHNKKLIREKLEVMRYADSIEIAGVEPWGGHNVGLLSNQCYLQSGQCHSGVSFRYHLLFRRKVGSNELAYIHPSSILSEHCVHPV